MLGFKSKKVLTANKMLIFLKNEKNKVKYLFVFCCVYPFFISAQSLNVKPLSEVRLFLPDSLSISKEQQKFNWNKVPYFVDDLLLTAGVNRSGLYYTRNYLELTHKNGFQMGIENYYPLTEKAFIHYGIQYAQRGFNHKLYDVSFTTHYIDMPLYLAYELPALRSFDWRLFVGTQLSFLTKTSMKGDYSELLNGTEDKYLYNGSQFQNYDWGFCFGLSMEYDQFYSRLRIFNGVVKLAPDDQGMNSAFYIEFGYFLFRKMRK
jgi:hypothetical protein